MNMQQYKISTDNIAVAILSGGRNRRMSGVNKSFIKVKNIPIIVTNSPQDYAAYGKDRFIVTDRIKDIGPLGGIFTALSQASKPAVFL